MTRRDANKVSGGFTVVELLVVIGVVAVLVGILLPALARARDAAAQLTCAANLRQWAAACLMYAEANHGWLPRRGQGAQPTSVIDRAPDWFNALPPVLRMPAYSERVAQHAGPRPGERSIWICPAAVDVTHAYYFAYAMNMRLSTWQSPTPDRLSRIGSWSTVVFMTEGPGAYCSVLPADAPYSPVARHRGARLNVAFLDGHVTSYAGQEIGCSAGDPRRADVRWTVPYSSWAGPGN